MEGLHRGARKFALVGNQQLSVTPILIRLRLADVAHRMLIVGHTGTRNVLELSNQVELECESIIKLNNLVVEAAEQEGEQRCVIDLSNVQYVGCALLGLLVNLRQRVKSAGGRLV